MRWRWLASADAPGAEQMAVDAGLLDRAAQTGEGVVRVFGWDQPTLSFGRHERARGRFDPDTLERAGVGVVRRPTGGRVLLHDGEVTYSVTMPADERRGLRDVFADVNALLAAALGVLGVRTTMAAPGRERRPGTDACFAAPSAGELVVDGRKIVASAQVRERGAILQHGSILLSDLQARIPTLAAEPMDPPLPGATLTEAVGRAVARDEVGDALHRAAGDRFGELVALEAAEIEAWAAPHRSRFADPAWTWHR